MSDVESMQVGADRTAKVALDAAHRAKQAKPATDTGSNATHVDHNSQAPGCASSELQGSAAVNAAAGKQWSGFQSPASSGKQQEPAQPANSTGKSGGIDKTLAANPSIKSNQDLINHFYQQGGGTWAGAAQQAKAAGVTMSSLVRDRKGAVSGGTQPSGSTPTPGSQRAPTTTPASETPATTTPSDGSYPVKAQYKPGSPEQMALFKAAAKKAGLPESWASSKGLQNILARESNGQVGRPNYTYGARAKDPAQWQSVQDELKRGIKSTKSSATGLGQLLLANVDKYYPSGRKGIGNPLEEAAGMLKYIKDRYGNPDNAWAQYGKRHEGY